MRFLSITKRKLTSQTLIPDSSYQFMKKTAEFIAISCLSMSVCTLWRWSWGISVNVEIQGFSHLGWASEDDAWDNLLCPGRWFSHYHSAQMFPQALQDVPPPYTHTHTHTSKDSAEHDTGSLYMCACWAHKVVNRACCSMTWPCKLFIISISFANPLKEDATCCYGIKMDSWWSPQAGN